jgi:Tol biopolymer transport system component
MFLHRWILNGVKYDRLLTANIDGEDLHVLLDDDMVSHCNWKDDNTIIAWANTHKFGNHYYILDDKSDHKKIFGKDRLIVDGHPSFSPDGKYMITDTYPNFKRKQKLILCDLENEKIVTLAEIYANIKYKNETRCDLHPRWKRDSSEICFDGAQKKYRQVYRLKITD